MTDLHMQLDACEHNLERAREAGNANDIHNLLTERTAIVTAMHRQRVGGTR